MTLPARIRAVPINTTTAFTMTTTTPICETASVKSSAALGDKVSSYWNTRAEGYSLRTADELNGPRGAHWQERLLSNLRGVPSGGSVLDVGCGPALLRHYRCPMRLESLWLRLQP